MAETKSAQVPVTFEDIAVYFCEDEWEMLAEWQKKLYKETMKENYETLTSLGLTPEKPSLISKIEREEDLCVRNQPDCSVGISLKSSWRAGDGIHHEHSQQNPYDASYQETHKMLLEKDKDTFILGSDGRKDREKEPNSRVYMGKNRHLCMDCGKSFNKKSNFQSHQRIHMGEKPFQCSKCDKCFRVKFSLKQHELVHVGEKPFECSECNKSFRQKSHLRMHERKHTKESNKKLEKVKSYPGFEVRFIPVMVCTKLPIWRLPRKMGFSKDQDKPR